jgi:hypothetical protein
MSYKSEHGQAVLPRNIRTPACQFPQKEIYPVISSLYLTSVTLEYKAQPTKERLRELRDSNILMRCEEYLLMRHIPGIRYQQISPLQAKPRSEKLHHCKYK